MAQSIGNGDQATASTKRRREKGGFWGYFGIRRLNEAIRVGKESERGNIERVRGASLYIYQKQPHAWVRVVSFTRKSDFLLSRFRPLDGLFAASTSVQTTKERMTCFDILASQDPTVGVAK